MRLLIKAVLVIFVVLVLACTSNDRALVVPVPPSDHHGSLYDPSRDPVADLHAALSAATVEKKRVLMVVGGVWCGWCLTLERFLEEKPEVSSQIKRRFVVVRIHYSAENENETFLAQYPAIAGCPHFFILEADGTLIGSQATAELEENGSYSLRAFEQFLRRWQGE